VTLKLGRIRRHHAAHATTSDCRAIQPETALHLNVKYFMAAVLERAVGGADRLRIRRQCIVGNRPYENGVEYSWVEATSGACGSVDDADWVDGWDEVRVESRLAIEDAYRIPDIVLRRDGTAIAAIEILASHAVDAEKAAMLARLEIPWIEVRAAPDLYEGANRWTIQQPLEPVAGSMSLAWRCEVHGLSTGMPRTRTAIVAERPPARPSLVAVRLVDVYREGGTWQRLAYRVRGIFADGALVRLALDRNGSLVESYDTARGESEATFRARIGKLIRRDSENDLRQLSRRAAVVDAGRWLRDEEAARMLERASKFRRRYRFDARTGAWELDQRAADLASEARAGIETAIRGRRSSVHRSLPDPGD
jgi:hypothetical protein